MEFEFAYSGDYGAIIHVIFKAPWVAVSEGLKNMIHEPLHAGGGICWTEAHYSRHIKSSGHFEGHQILCFFSISHIPVAIAEVKLTEKHSIAHPFNNGVDMGERENIFNRNSVDFPIVEYWPKTPILLFNIEDRC